MIRFAYRHSDVLTASQPSANTANCKGLVVFGGAGKRAAVRRPSPSPPSCSCRPPTAAVTRDRRHRGSSRATMTRSVPGSAREGAHDRPAESHIHHNPFRAGNPALRNLRPRRQARRTGRLVAGTVCQVALIRVEVRPGAWVSEMDVVAVDDTAGNSTNSPTAATSAPDSSASPASTPPRRQTIPEQLRKRNQRACRTIHRGNAAATPRVLPDDSKARPSLSTPRHLCAMTGFDAAATAKVR
jgi:hypothetical protein